MHVCLGQLKCITGFFDSMHEVAPPPTSPPYLPPTPPTSKVGGGATSCDICGNFPIHFGEKEVGLDG